VCLNSCLFRTLSNHPPPLPPPLSSSFIQLGLYFYGLRNKLYGAWIYSRPTTIYRIDDYWNNVHRINSKRTISTGPLSIGQMCIRPMSTRLMFTVITRTISTRPTSIGSMYTGPIDVHGSNVCMTNGRTQDQYLQDQCLCGTNVSS